MERYNENMIRIMKQMIEESRPVGAIYLGEKLGIPQASVGRILYQLETSKLAEKVARHGRVLTLEGEEFLKNYEIQHSRIQTVNDLVNVNGDGFDKKKMLEVMDVRILLEVKTAELASKNGTKKEREELKKCILEWKLALCNEELGSEEDLKLHLMIAKMSGNFTLYSMCKLLLTENNVYTGFSAKAEQLTTIQSEQHDAIVNAILEGNTEKAREGMFLHLSTIIKDIEKNV